MRHLQILFACLALAVGACGGAPEPEPTREIYTVPEGCWATLPWGAPIVCPDAGAAPVTK